MKKIFTLAIALTALLGQSVSVFSQDKKLGEFKLENMMSQDPDGGGGKSKMQSIQEALEWRNMLLQDENGNILPSYHINAVAQATQMRSNASQRSASLQWEELGPGNIGGRTRSILYDKRDTSRQTMYAGAVGGGLWKSLDGGNTWAQLASLTSCLAVSCIAQDANGTIYFGTGEGLAEPSGTSRNSGQVGNGLHMLYGADQDSVLPSTIPTSISNSVGWCMINRIAIDPNNPQNIYVATSGYNNAPCGLEWSQDGGMTWTLIGSSAAPISGLSSGYNCAADVKFSSDGTRIFASVGMYLGAFPGVNFIESQDDGQTWTYVPASSFPQFPGSVSRMEIGVAPSDPLTVYLVVADYTASGAQLGGIYKSADGGNTWSIIGSPGGVLYEPFGTDGQGWYDNVISVNPFDADKVFFGGTQLYTYTSQSGWSLASIYFGDESNPQWVHADMHAIVFNDKNENEMFVGCDGGIFKSDNAFSGFPQSVYYTAKNRGYAVTENYSVAASYYGAVLGGAQDNGTNYVDYLQGGTTYATNVYGGDGVYADISHFNPNIFIGGYVSGNDYRSNTSGYAWLDPFDGVIDPQGYTEPSICGQAKGAGNAPFVTAFWLIESKTAYNSIDSVQFSDTLTHYAGETLTLTSRIKQTFQVTLTDSISKNTVVSFVDPLKGELYFASACGLWMTPDILDFSNTPRWFRITNSSDDVKSLTATPSADTIYFGRNSTVQVMTGMNSILAFDTASRGHNDILLTSGANFTQNTYIITNSGRYIEGIDVDINDHTHVLCVAAGYSASGTPHVYVTNNSGATWTPLPGTGSGVLPNMPVYQCVIDAYNASHYIIGSELGVWDSYDGGNTWTEQNSGINAQVPVFRLRQQTYLSDQCYALYLGTHGRGMWRSTTLTSASPNGCSVNALGISTPTKTINNLLVYPNPVTTGSSSKVAIELSEPSTVTLRMIDMPGRLLQEVTYNNLPAGKNEMNLNTSNLSNGTYLVVGTLSNGQTMTRTIVIAK
jgi:hypothetical protein